MTDTDADDRPRTAAEDDLPSEGSVAAFITTQHASDDDVEEEEAPGDSLGNASIGELGGAQFRVGQIDADRLRSSVANKLFGAAAEPMKIGRFTVLKRLGAGGMGVVYSAYDDTLDRKVAIKLLHASTAEGRHRARLMREAQALARLSHPNVIHVYEVGTFRGQVFVAMEFVPGHTLSSVELGDQYGVYEVLALFIQAARGLAAAHDAGLVHRDFKPENALVGENDGRVRVLDFGLARAAGDRSRDEESTGLSRAPRPTLDDDELEQLGLSASGTNLSSSDSLEAPLTRTGAIMGTPAYMSPEQHLGAATDERTDQFSFCVALWEKLYGERPFAGKNVSQLAINVTTGRVRDTPSGSPVPKWVRRALQRGLAVKPEDRYPTMEALIAALSRDRRTRRIYAAAAAVAVAVGVGGYFVADAQTTDTTCEGSERELEGIWDDARREEVHAAFVRTKVPYAEDAFAGTRALLDAYTGEWVEMHRRSCVAAMIDKRESPELFGQKMVCLGQRLTAVEQLMGVLTEADAGVVRRAVEAAGSLESLDRCEDQGALMALDSPLDEETRAKLDELDAVLARGRSRLALGQYKDALAQAERAVTMADDLGHPSREAQARLLLGESQSRMKEIDGAEESLREALRRADVASDDDTRVRAWIKLLRVVGVDRRDTKAASHLARDARAALERVGSAPLLEAELETQLGSIALAQGNYQEAEAHHRKALEHRERELGDGHTLVARSLNNLANAIARQQRYAESERVHRRALANFEKTLGGSHPYVAVSLNNIAANLLDQGRKLSTSEPQRAAELFAESEASSRRAIEIREKAFGKDHVAVVSSVHNLGEALRGQKRFEDALAAFDRALGIKERVYGKDDPRVAKTLTDRGKAQLEAGNVAFARKDLERAAALRRAGAAEVPPDELADTLEALARSVYREGKDVDEARSIAEEAVAAYGRAGEAYAAKGEQVKAWLGSLPKTASAPGDEPGG